MVCTDAKHILAWHDSRWQWNATGHSYSWPYFPLYAPAIGMASGRRNNKQGPLDADHQAVIDLSGTEITVRVRGAVRRASH